MCHTVGLRGAYSDMDADKNTDGNTIYKVIVTPNANVLDASYVTLTVTQEDNYSWWMAWWPFSLSEFHALLQATYVLLRHSIASQAITLEYRPCRLSTPLMQSVPTSLLPTEL